MDWHSTEVMRNQYPAFTRRNLQNLFVRHALKTGFMGCPKIDCRIVTQYGPHDLLIEIVIGLEANLHRDFRQLLAFSVWPPSAFDRVRVCFYEGLPTIVDVSFHNQSRLREGIHQFLPDWRDRMQARRKPALA